MNLMQAKLITAAVIALIIGFVPISEALANEGGAHGGGGDLECDAKIKSIAGNVEEWIDHGGAEIGRLSLSSSKNPLTGRPYSFEEYREAMLSLLRLPLNSSCISKSQSSVPVTVEGSAKVCKTYAYADHLQMICDRDLLLKMNSDLQIEQIHHEFAINVPGLEVDSGPISSYRISNQLSAFTENVVERRLKVMAPQADSQDPQQAFQKTQDRSRQLIQLAQSEIDYYFQIAEIKGPRGSDFKFKIDDSSVKVDNFYRDRQVLNVTTYALSAPWVCVTHDMYDVDRQATMSFNGAECRRTDGKFKVQK